MTSYPPYPPPPPQKRSRGPLLLVGGLVLLLVVIVVTAVVLVVNRADGKPAADKSSPPARTKPSDPAAVEFRRVLTAKPGICPTPAPQGTACDAKGMRYTLGKVELDGSNVSEVKAAYQQNSTYWYVGLTLDAEGAKLFGQLTAGLAKQNPPANQLAIVVRNEVVTAPTVQSAITEGKIEISGAYNRDSAEELAAKITG
jgi:preprotein translocase subunit SecD